MPCFCTVLDLDTISEMTNGKLLFLGFTCIDQMKIILICAVLELPLEVTSLKTELVRVGTDIKGVTDTTSELTIENTFLQGMTIKMLLFCTVWSWTPSLR